MFINKNVKTNNPQGVHKMTETEIPFNKWSIERIAQGRKFCTSRHKRYTEDDRVGYISPLMDFGYIKKYLWKLEGADSPEELQQVIEDIYKRKVPDDEMFYVHFGDFR